MKRVKHISEIQTTVLENIQRRGAWIITPNTDTVDIASKSVRPI